MIPKIIHYCWFGGKEKPKDVELCIESWKKVMPDYLIMEWNEQNFRIADSNQYVREAYACKKWAFVSDYVRLVALYEYGGLYFDTDVETFRRFDCLLEDDFFAGFEAKDYVAAGVLGASKYNEFIKDFIISYDGRSFIHDDGSFDITTNVNVLTSLLKKRNLRINGKEQRLTGNMVIYPQLFFYSNDLINLFHRYRKGIFSYHHSLSSWYEKKRGKGLAAGIKHYAVGILRNTLGTDKVCEFRDKIKI